MSQRRGKSLIALVFYGLAAFSGAQLGSLDLNACYLTTTVIYGNGTAENSSIKYSSTSASSQSTMIVPPTSIQTSAAATTTTEGEVSPSLSMFPSIITTASTTSTTSLLPPPTSSPFLIQVTFSGNRLRSRAGVFVGFVDDVAHLNASENFPAVFVLTSRGELLHNRLYVGPTTNAGAAALVQSPDQSIDGPRWRFEDPRLLLADTKLVTFADGHLSAIFPGNELPVGAIEIAMTPEYIEDPGSTTTPSFASTISVSRPASTVSAMGSTTVTRTVTAESTSQSTSSYLSLTSDTMTSASSSPSSSHTTTVSSAGPSSDTTQATSSNPPTSSLPTQTASSPASDSATTTVFSTSTSTSSHAVSTSDSTTSTILHSATTSTLASSLPSSPTTHASLSSPAVTSSHGTSTSSQMSSTLSTGPSIYSTSTSSPSTTSRQMSSSEISTTSPSSTTSPPTISSASSSLPLTTLASSTSSGSSSLQLTSLASTTPTSSLASSTTNVLSSQSSSQPSGRSSTTTSLNFSVSSVLSSTTRTSMSTITNTTRSTSTVTGTRSSTSTTAATSTTMHTSTNTSPTSTSLTFPTPYPAKRGLTYTNVTTLVYYPPPSPYISWAYNYYSLPNASDHPGPYPSTQYRFIPLLYNDAPSLTSIWAANVETSLNYYGTDAIFGFNEPDACYSGKSACMSVNASVQGYANFMQRFASRVLIGAPAVTNSGEDGLAYLAQFLGNATTLSLTIDFVNLHWYASPYDMAYFIEYVSSAYARFGLPVWVTEFGMDYPNYDQATVVQFLRNASAWMDAQPWVHRYAWFGNFNNADPAGQTEFLLNRDGSARSVLGDVWYAYNGTGR